MLFTYDAYVNLVGLLKKSRYNICDYHNWREYDNPAILRHDIDESPTMALELAQIEADLGAKSTYFVLLTSDFYNVASTKNIEIIRKISDLGHEIGLHFDEVAYSDEVKEKKTIPQLIINERNILSDIVGLEINTVSMHRPSKDTLEADYEIPSMINSYSKTFFNEFKYLSDSRRNWREPVEKIVENREYDKLHILTHAFWYHDVEESIEKTVTKFIKSANKERYYILKNNISSLESIINEEEI